MLHLLPLLSTLGLACFTTAAPPIESETPEAAPEAIETVASAGFQAVIDPITGHIVNNPTDAELERLSEGVAPQKRRSAWALRDFALATGGRGVFLDGWADHSLVVEQTAEGQIRSVCSQGDPHTPATARPKANER